MPAANPEIPTFLDMVFGAKPKDSYILLWEKTEQKRSAWFRDVGRAVQFAAAHTVNLYAGVALSPHDFGPYHRCKAADTAGLVGIGSDIDVAGPGHQSQNLPPTERDALLLLPPEFPPSTLIHSGHGLQAWWLFETPTLFTGDDDRERARALTRSWDRYIRARALARGWDVDAVHDLARVLRVPGTINRKPGLPDVAAHTIATSAIRYSPADFAEILEQSTVSLSTSSATKRRPESHINRDEPGKDGGQPRVNPMFLVANAIDKVNNGAHRNDTGLWLLCQLRDDRHTAAQAAEFGAHYVAAVSAIKDDPYTYAEFKDTLRSVYSRPPRKQWDDYEERDIGTEPDDKPQENAAENMMDGDPETSDGVQFAAPARPTAPAESAAPETAAASTVENHGPVFTTNSERTPDPVRMATLNPHVPEAEKQKARTYLKQALHLDITRVVKHGESDGFYVLHLADGRKVDLGRTAKFASEQGVRLAVIDGLGSLLPPIKKGAWRKVLDSLLKLVEVESGFTPEEMVTEWVESFLEGRARGFYSLKEATPAIAYAYDLFNGKVQFDLTVNSLYETGPGGVVVLKLRPLYQYITQQLNAKLSQPDLAVFLGRVGFRKCSTFNGPMWQGERLRLQRVWVAPAKNFHLADLNGNRFDPSSPRYASEPQCPAPGTPVQ
jgi:hypothetical protein